MKQKAKQLPGVLEEINRQNSLGEQNRRQIRFKYNLAVLCQGSVAVLGSNEFVAGLGEFLSQDRVDREERGKILTALGRGVVSPEQTIRERTLSILSLTAVHALQRDEEAEIVLLVRNLGKWLVYEEEVLPGLEVVVKRVEELVDWLFKLSLWSDAAEILDILSGISSGSLKKNPAIRSLAGRTLSNLASRSVINKHIEYCLGNGSENADSIKLLKYFNRQATPIIFERCEKSKDRMEIQALLQLLSIFSGKDFPRLLGDHLHVSQSVDVLHEIIRFFAEQGDDSMFPVLQEFYAHPDLQIQHEMIRYVVVLGGRAMRARLLTGLGMVDDRLKVPIIRLLAEHAAGDDTALQAICAAVEELRNTTPGVREGLVRAVAIALRAFPCQQSIELLGRLRRECQSLGQRDRLLLQIDQSLNILTPQMRHKRKIAEVEEVVFDSDPLHKQLAAGRKARIEEEVKKYLRRGDSGGAGRLLIREARAAGGERDFAAAELLRDRILEVDPMALVEVVQLGEWLERQKRAMTEPLQAEIWRDLRDQLTSAECRALQKALNRETYGKGDAIVRAGELDASLFFLASGEIGLNCRARGDERFLRRLKPGSVLGGSQFFTSSVWTFSLRALSDVQVHLLGRDTFLALIEKHPGLESKLHRHCTLHDNLAVELLKEAGDDRREFPRIPAVRLISYSLPDSYGTKESREYSGELIDISRNGLAFTIKLSSYENARLLLGREILSTLGPNNGATVRCSGIVVGVRRQEKGAGGFSIHVKLSSLIDDIVLDRVVCSKRN